MAHSSLFRTAGRTFSPSHPGVSELYASMLMIGVTISLGSLVTAVALNQFSSTAAAESAGASLRQSYSGTELSLIFSTVSSPGTCPSLQGAAEGTVLTLSVYNYGRAAFTADEIAVNQTVFVGPFPSLPAGSLSDYALTLGSCVHASGQTILFADSSGDEVQLET